MGFEVWLTGDFNLDKIYQYLHGAEWVDYLSSIDRGRFTVHLKDVKGVSYQFYSRGNIRVLLDHYSRPFHHIQIIRLICLYACGRDPHLKLKNIRVYPEDVEAYFIRKVLREAGIILEPRWVDFLESIILEMLKDLLDGLNLSLDEALPEFEREDKPSWWRFLEVEKQAENQQ